MRPIKARSILSKRNVFNLYHGCTNNCLYCPTRSRLSGVKDFTNVGVKINAIELLESALRTKRKKCMLHTGTLGDPYQKTEEDLKLFREILKTVYEKRFGITILTKSVLALRDIDLLEKINRETKVVLQIALSTLDERKQVILEPVSSARERLNMIKTFTERGISVIVPIEPVLPLLNDGIGEFKRVLDAVQAANPSGSARR